MNWTIVLLLSIFGLIMGLLSIRGYTQRIEPYLWLLFGIATSLILSKNIDNKTFLHGVLIGLSWGILNGAIQSLFFGKYITNNPSLRENFNRITFIQPRYFVLVTGPIIGLITGVVLGGLTFLLKKIW